jgi:hypothetical protein
MAQAAVHRAREASLRLAQILDKNRPAATRVWKPALAMVGIFSLVSLIALPQASKFVGFDGAGTNLTAQAYSAASRADSVVLPEQAAVVPASLRMDDPAAMQKVNRVRTRVSSEKQVAPLRAAAVRFNPRRLAASAAGERIVAIRSSASGDGEAFVPQFQTVVFIETAQYGNSAAQFWSVQVWHVTLLRAERERMVRVPVASSI